MAVKGLIIQFLVVQAHGNSNYDFLCPLNHDRYIRTNRFSNAINVEWTLLTMPYFCKLRRDTH